MLGGVEGDRGCRGGQDRRILIYVVSTLSVCWWVFRPELVLCTCFSTMESPPVRTQSEH